MPGGLSITSTPSMASIFSRKGAKTQRKDARFLRFSLDPFAPLRLCARKCLMPLTTDEFRRRTFERAIKLLAAKPRSVAELRERLLQRKGTTEDVVETVIARLREYGYLNDERLAFSYASFKVKHKPVG